MAKLVGFCFDCVVRAVSCGLSISTTYSRLIHVAEIISVLVCILIKALFLLKFASVPLMLSLDIKIRLDLNPGVYRTLSKVIVLFTPLMFV